MKKVINFLGQKFVYEGQLKNELPEGYGVLKNTKGILALTKFLVTYNKTGSSVTPTKSINVMTK